MTKLNKLFEAYVEENHGGAVTQAAIEAAYKNFLGLPGDFPARDERIAYWVEKNISAANFAEQFLKEAAELNAKNAAAWGVTTEGRKAVVSAARDAAENADNLEVIRQRVEDEVESQPDEGEQPGVPGEIFSLTTGVDVVRNLTDDDYVVDEEGERVLDEEGNPQLTEEAQAVKASTANNDTIEALIASRSSRTTLNNDDNIDGGAGFNTLSVSMENNFGGFVSDEGGLTNIQRVELTNEGARARRFDTKDIEGVKEYALYMKEGAVELQNLINANITVEAHELARGEIKLGFTNTAATASTNDTLDLVLNNVGTEASGCGRDAVPERVVDLVVSNGGQINTLALTALGVNNLINVGGTGRDAITVAGAGDITVSGVNTTLKTFDASAATGDVTATLNAVTSRNLKEISGGEGDDVFTVNTSSLATIAEINGGAGANKLVIKNTGTQTIQPSMENIQTLTARGEGRLTISSENISDLNTIAYGMSNAAATSRLLVSGLEVDLLNLLLEDGANGEVTYTGEGELVISTEAGDINDYNCDGDLISTNPTFTSALVTASRAENVTVNISAYSQFNGRVVAGDAEEVTLNIESALFNSAHTGGGTVGQEATQFFGTLDATKAAVVNINADGLLNGVIRASEAESLNMNVTADNANAQTIALRAVEAEELTLDVTGDGLFTFASVTLDGNTTNTNLDKLNTLTVNTSANVQMNTSLESLESAVIAGTGSFVVGTAQFAQSAQEQDVTVTPNNGAAKGKAVITFGGVTVADLVTGAKIKVTLPASASGTGDAVTVEVEFDATTANDATTVLTALDAAITGTPAGGFSADTDGILAFTYTADAAIDDLDAADVEFTKNGQTDAETTTISSENGSDEDVPATVTFAGINPSTIQAGDKIELTLAASASDTGDAVTVEVEFDATTANDATSVLAALDGAITKNTSAAGGFSDVDGALTFTYTADGAQGDLDDFAAVEFSTGEREFNTTGLTAVGKESDSVEVDASDLVGDFAIKVVKHVDDQTDVTNGSAEIIGTTVGTNVISVQDREEIAITGGIQDDTISVRGYVEAESGSKIATAELTGGLGEDTFNLSVDVGTKMVVTITDFVPGDDILNVGTFTSVTNKSIAQTWLKTNFEISSSDVDADNITLVNVEVDSGPVVTGFVYNGEVYVGNADILVELSGLSEADYTLA